MIKCAACGTEARDGGRFCSACGALLGSGAAAQGPAFGPDADVTATASETAPALPRTPGDEARTPGPHDGRGEPGRLRSSGPGLRTPAQPTGRTKTTSSSARLSTEGRFLPGTFLVDRYRVVALLGKGGMGEVYRADDLTLDQPVALKFLPAALASDQEALERFRNEVRIARRVSHTNVCRVYDVGEAEGQPFLSMEYVDGEDLASLLRRIGRLPGDKALEIARQLCAGLSAAHREGVLHRDLKPANVMLDGRGRAVMMDFGLAGVAEQIQGYDVRSGTPAYMAPEQLSGREVTESSDIYSLGLVLYEIFTGKRAFDATALADLVRQRNEQPLSAPSTWVKDLDPAVERVIMRCLERDPAARPATALAVAAALPGGDPLAAALAAGETPSPQMVAAAGEKEGIAPRVAVASLAGVLIGLAVVAWMSWRVSGMSLMTSPLPPDVLNEKAQGIIQSLGYAEHPVDHSAEFYFDDGFVQYAHNHDGAHPDWQKILTERPPILIYPYRESPVYLDPDGFHDLTLTPGVPSFWDPPATQSGMVNIIVDAQGRLTYLQAIPKEVEPNPPPAVPLDWKPLFAAAGLDMAQFRAAEPQWLSLAAFDARAAWTGTWPGSGRPLRIEAAAWRGRPVYFNEISAWTQPDRTQISSTDSGQHASQIITVLIAILTLAGGSWMARRNYRNGKVDLRGAWRLASAVFVVEIAIWIASDHFIPTLATFGRFVLAVSTALFVSGAIWMLYLALEPFVRRHWPQAIISWSRLLAGGGRDPMVGRDVLWGVLLGVLWSVVIGVGLLLLKREGAEPQFPASTLLLGGRALFAWTLKQVVQCVISTLEFFFLLFLFRVLVRNKWLAGAIFVALFTTQNTLQNDHRLIMVWIWILVFIIAAFAATRFGLVTLAVAIFVANELYNIPLTPDVSAWYAPGAWTLLVGYVAIAVWGFHTALAGQRLLKSELFE
ncbi:MAG TPA: protein kinase [Terriglobia bacterium]|nr:protein kinase [Terriglobia bacterium]